MRSALPLLASIWLLATSPYGGHRGLPFYGPDNIVVDARGNIFVTDSDHRGNFRVVELNATGKYVTEWHVFTASAPPSGPEGIAIDRSGNIFATDAGARRVLKISPAGNVLATFGGKDVFVNPGHVAVDGRGFVYVADAAANTIATFSSNGQLVASWRRAHGSGREQFAGPESVAVSARNMLYVEDWGNRRLMELDRHGTTTAMWGPGTGTERIGNSAGIAVSPSGRVYVADWGRHRIAVFGANGTFVRAISNEPSKPRRFANGPTSIYVDSSGSLYYADGNSIRVLDANDRLVHVFS